MAGPLTGLGSTGSGGIMPPANTNANDLTTTQPSSVFYGSQQQNAQNGANAQTGAASQLNQYSAGQQQLQSALPQQYQDLLSGNGQIPPYWTAPPQVFKAYNDQFNMGPAHQLAAQFGAGSPQIAATQSQGNQDLAARLYQGGFTNYLNALGQEQSYAVTPMGQQSANTGASNWQQQGNQNTLGYQTSSPLGALGLGGAAAGSALTQLIGLFGG